MNWGLPLNAWLGEVLRGGRAIMVLSGDDLGPVVVPSHAWDKLDAQGHA
jgi:hypothetical protein